VAHQAATFIGRALELEALLALGRRVAGGGGPAAVLILGDPGSGKSRLVAEATARITVRNKLRVVGFEPARQVPLAAASDLLRALTRAPRDGRRLRGLLYDAPASPNGLQPLGLFEAAHRALRALGPSLILADDLQWADEQTLALCHYLMRAAQTLMQPVALIAASRPSRNADTLVAALEELLPQDSLATLTLKPLSRQEGLALAAELAPGQPADRAGALWARAQGSPFWIAVLAQSADAGPDAASVVGARLRGLGADSIAVFAILTVVGRPLAPLDLAALLSWDPRRVDVAAGQLTNRGIVVQRGTALAVAHDLIREAALQQLPLHERQRIHRRIAAWLEGDAGDDVGQLRLALEHRRASGLATAGVALRLAVAKNRCLMGAAGFRVLANIADEADPDADETLVLQQHVASLALEMGDWSAALDRFARLSDDERLAPADRGRAAYGAATAAYELKRAEEAHIYLARCLETGDPLLNIEAESLHSQIIGWLENRTAEAIAHAARAAADARQLIVVAGGPHQLNVFESRAVVSGLRAAFEAAIWDDNATESVRISEELIEAGRSLGDAGLTATLQADYICLLPRGRLREVEVRSGRVLKEARRRLLPVSIAGASYNLALVQFTRGRLAQARAHATEAVELSDRGVLPAHISATQVRTILYLIAASQGAWREALQELADCVAAQSNPHHRTVARRELARWLARFGGMQLADRVRRELAAGMADVEAAACERCHWQAVLAAIEACARIGKPEEARDFAAQWDARHADPFPWYRLLRRQSEALLVAMGGDVRPSLPLFELARVEAERIGASLEALWAQIDLGEALASINRELAIATLQAAAAAADALGSGSARQRAEAALRTLGVRTWKRTADMRDVPLSVLSAREREVLRLVTEGASNPEIASAIFLSRKTVERHVSNILLKMGARNRTELAGTLGRAIEAADG